MLIIQGAWFDVYIQQAINDNYKIIYSSYGEKNIKKQMGYMIENYACVMPKN